MQLVPVMPRRNIRNHENQEQVESASSEDDDQEGRFVIESVQGIRKQNGQVGDNMSMRASISLSITVLPNWLCVQFDGLGAV